MSILPRKRSNTLPDSKVRGANMGPIWGRQDPGGPPVGPMHFAIWAAIDAATMNRHAETSLTGNAILMKASIERASE